MRKVLLLLAAVAMLATAGVAGAETDVRWADTSWDDIIKQAKDENKYIFIDFFTTWCGPCKRLDKVTYVDEKVVGFLNSNVPVKYDAEKGFGEELANEYKVAHFPTLVVIGPDGKEVDRHIGYLEPEEFMLVIKGYTEGVGTVAWYEKQLAENPDDIETLHTLGVKHADALRPEQAETALMKVLKMDPNDEHGWHAEIAYSLAEVNYTTENYEAAKEHFENLIKKFAGTDWVDRGLTRLAAAEYKLGNNEAAVNNYKKYLDGHPEDPRAMNGFAWFCSQRGIGLDVALPVALKASELSNRDPGILDTLAEVYFAMGDFDNAIKIGKEALESDPEDQYFKDQV
jgi:thiol-disulfide isomerase/thioredoxin/Flp pilus assembly protein TadD